MSDKYVTNTSGINLREGEFLFPKKSTIKVTEDDIEKFKKSNFIANAFDKGALTISDKPPVDDVQSLQEENARLKAELDELSAKVSAS